MIARDRSGDPDGGSRIPACTYRVSAEMRSALAICWRISAEGRRSPRSIWLRYGLEIPASSERRRSESRAEPRCSRMKEPRSSQRSLGSVLTLASVPPQRVAPELASRPCGGSVPRSYARWIPGWDLAPFGYGPARSSRTSTHDDHHEEIRYGRVH